jgi:hypothetical protein
MVIDMAAELLKPIMNTSHVSGGIIASRILLSYFSLLEKKVTEKEANYEISDRGGRNALHGHVR